MQNRIRFVAGFLTLLLLAFTFTGNARTINPSAGVEMKTLPGPNRVPVLDGRNVHNVGELWMHVSNWGLFGSYPNSSAPFSHAPSAQWPPGSGVEYLYGAGLWVGAIKDGIPAVSTAAYEMEFWPTDSPTDTIYRSFEGAPGGNRYPSPHSDDDGDGLIDEDRLDGHDNDNDGLIDEDYAAISDQMFSCWYTDDQAASSERYPEHNPLNIMVRQESYQWEDNRFDDFVGITYTITNIGADILEDVYLGFFADIDAGPRNQENYWNDDEFGQWFGTLCTELGPVSINLAYGYDRDGDNGQTPGYCGVMLLGHSTDPLGLYAPKQERLYMFRIFTGDQPYENGGDPTNDFQRYEVMSSCRIDFIHEGPADSRLLIGVGPFPMLEPGQSIALDLGFVIGEGLDGLLANAAFAQRLFDGTWYDLDGDPMTGIDRRESPVYGPAQGVVIDECRPELSDPIDVPEGEVVWVNSDCPREADFKEECAYAEEDSLLFRTGVAGNEFQIHWVISPLLGGLDIKPGSCPNPFNVKWFDFSRKKGRRGRKCGVLPVAILGSAYFDVRDVDISTVHLLGVPPLSRRRRYVDVSRPAYNQSGCECTTEGPDGYLDLVLTFSRERIAGALSSSVTPVPGEEVAIALLGELKDGTSFIFTDCIKFVGRPHRPDSPGGEPRLLPASPNPFNPVTLVTYYLPERQYVRLSIYDVSGRLVEVLADAIRDTGEHTIEWNARGMASGVYFLRLETGEFVQTKKIVLLR